MNYIQNRSDILNVLYAFYSEVQKDPEIGIIFNEN